MMPWSSGARTRRIAMHCTTNHDRMAAHRLSRRGVLMAGGTSAMLLMATAACLRRSGKGTQLEQPPFKVGSRPAELRLHVRSGAEQDTLEERLPIFEQQFKGVTVKVEDFPGGEYQAKIVALFAGNALGDVLWGGNAQSQSLLWAHMGALRAVDDLVRADKLDLGQYYRASVDGGRLDGKLYGLPFKLHPSFCILYHNASAVHEAGAPLPDANTTWEQLMELGKRLQRSEGGQVARWGLLVPAGGQPMQFFACWARAWSASAPIGAAASGAAGITPIRASHAGHARAAGTAGTLPACGKGIDEVDGRDLVRIAVLRQNRAEVPAQLDAE
ncbi:MAG: hypothetical protein C4289_06575 [Chloroflexota bacterium]